MKTRILTMGAITGLALILGSPTAFGQAFGQDRRGGGGGDSAALAAASRVIAVPDTRSNSVVVVASSDTMRLVQDLIETMEDMTSETMRFEVFPLQYAEADDLADAIGELFEPQTQTSSRRATTRVRAESDDQTNSVLVAAPIEDMETIERLVSEIDTMSEDPTELRVFPLRFADAEELATTIEDLFAETSSSRNRDQPRRFGGGPFGFFGRGSDRGGSRGSSNQSNRRVQEETVTAVADTRTNSIVVRAASEIMTEIAKMVEDLDRNPARSKKVFAIKLDNANPEEIVSILESMFGSQDGRGGNFQTRTTQQPQRQTGTMRNTSNRGGSSRGSSTRGGDGGFGSLR